MHTEGHVYLLSWRHGFMRPLLSCRTQMDLRIEIDLQGSCLQNKEEERVKETRQRRGQALIKTQNGRWINEQCLHM